MKRRLVGVLVIVAVVFVISLLLPHPGTVKTDESNQRVTLDLTGKEPEPLHTTPTPVPPVIAAAPAAVDSPKPVTPGSDNPPSPVIEEPPVVSSNLPAESMTDDDPPPKEEKPADNAPAKPVAPAAKPKPEVAATTPTKPALAKGEGKPTLKLDDSLKQKSPATASAKPAEKVPPRKIAKAPEAPAKPTPPPAKATAAASGKHWFVQVGAFSEVGKAHQALDKLAAKGLKGLIAPLDSAKGTLYRARIGPFSSRDQAKQAQDRAGALGYSGSSVLED